jgi:heme exporter protein CcmD
MNAFLNMGGYAAYVWSSIGLAIVVLAWNVFAARRLHARARDRALQRAAAGKGGR